MASWGVADEKTETELHKTRLLNIEEKPFKRITKRLATVSSLVSKNASTPNTQSGQDQVPNPEINSLKQDLLLDFAAFDSNIARLQFLFNANERERVRYQADKERILAECQAVRVNNAQLREQLEGARATLAQRKKFDELAEKITSNKLLRPRDDQITSLAKLEEECKELERESETYSETWEERKEQFSKIMNEGMHLRRQIRDEKEEVDRREGMNEGGDDDEAADRLGQTPRIDPNSSATPRPDGETQASKDGTTPRPGTSQGASTPAGTSLGQDSLKPVHNLASFSAAASRDGTPLLQADEGDVEMENQDSSAQGTGDGSTPRPQISVDAPQKDRDSMEVDF